MSGGSEMRDWGFVAPGFPEFRPHSDFPKLEDGFAECRGGCGRLVLVLDRFCKNCAELNRQMERKRLANIERTARIRTQQERLDMGFVEMPETEGEDRFHVAEHPVAAGLFGVLFTCAVGAAIWYVPRLLTRFGLWLIAGQ